MFGRLLGWCTIYTRNSARCKIHLAFKSCVILYWQRYCMALEQWASAKICGVVSLRDRAAIPLDIGPSNCLVDILCSWIHLRRWRIILPIPVSGNVRFTISSPRLPRYLSVGYAHISTTVHSSSGHPRPIIGTRRSSVYHAASRGLPALHRTSVAVARCNSAPWHTRPFSITLLGLGSTDDVVDVAVLRCVFSNVSSPLWDGEGMNMDPSSAVHEERERE